MEIPVALNITPLNAPHRELEYLPLVDKDFQIKDLVFSESPLQIYCRCRDNFTKGLDTIGLWNSNLPRYLLPSVHIFPQIIHHSHASYDPNLKVVLAPNQSILFPITAQSINIMLHFEPSHDLTPLSIEELLEKSTQLSPETLKLICETFMLPEHQPDGPPPYGHAYFTELGKLILNMISFIMGFNTSEYVDELTLVLLSNFIPGEQPVIKYDFASYIADKIHNQFLRLENEKVFKYSSFIYHLLIYSQCESFPIDKQKLSVQGDPRSVIFWSAITHCSSASTYSYKDFIDLFVHPATTLLTGVAPPRISNEIKKTLQLSKVYKVGDWYLYKNHSEIRIYGSELCPFKLPKYVPMRLFALEYFRQMNNSDVIHFFNAKKKAQLRINSQLGPFICNSREAEQEAHKILEDHMRLQQSFYWVPYDPVGFICDKRMKNKLAPYFHRRIPEIEQYANRDEWLEGTLNERDNEENKMENVMKDLWKMLDLEFFGQVQVPEVGPSSAGNIQQKPQEDSPLVVVESKGKEKEPDVPIREAVIMTEEPPTSKEMDPIPVTSEQTPPVETSVLQTPLNLEKNKKRDAEAATPSTQFS